MDESDPLRDTSGDPHLSYRGTDDYAIPRNQHDLVLGKNFHHPDDITCLLGVMDGDYSLPPAPLHTILVDVRTFAEPVLGNDENRRFALEDDHSHDCIAFAQLDSLHTGCVASHFANILLVEADGQSVTCCEDDVVRPARHLNVDQLVIRLDLDCLDAVRARVGLLRERALLDGAVLRAEKKELSVAELTHRNHRLDLRVRLNVDQVDDRLSTSGAACLRDLVDLEPEAAAVVAEAEDVVVRRADEQSLDEILFLETLTAQPASAAALLAIRRN